MNCTLQDAETDIEQTRLAILELRSNILQNGTLLPFTDKGMYVCRYVEYIVQSNNCLYIF